MHALRHTYASHALDSGLSTHILAAMLGHGSPDTTWAAYYDPTKAGLEAALRATHRGA